MAGEKCSSGCKTKDHDSWGECVSAKSVTISGCDTVSGNDTTNNRRFQGRLDRYRNLRRQGIQPRTTLERDISLAEKASQERGEAYRADKEWDYIPTPRDRLEEAVSG